MISIVSNFALELFLEIDLVTDFLMNTSDQVQDSITNQLQRHFEGNRRHH